MPGGTAFARPTSRAVWFVGPRKRSATGHDGADAATPGGATFARPTSRAVRFVGPVSEAPPGVAGLMLQRRAALRLPGLRRARCGL